MSYRITMVSGVLLIIAMLLGCSSGSAPTVPVLEKPAALSVGTSHHTWGLWQFVADPDAQVLDVIQLRNGSVHINALPFLEPPKLSMLTLESIEFNGNVIDVDIGVRHPFLGLTKFTGFDVCGILITNGSVTGFDDPDMRMAGDGDTRLLNADGLTRWWNPAEFPVNNGTIFGYTDGLLGSPDSIADYNCTLNGYKYFCDDLDDVNDPLEDISLENRGMFSPGQKNVRHYTIELGTEGLVFNYAIDACWAFPDGTPPWQAPDDFAPKANRVEAYRIAVTEVSNTLWNNGSGSGGDLSLMVDVYDWFNADQNTVIVESPGNTTSALSSSPIGGGEGYSTYQVDITDSTPAPDSIDLVIAVASEELNYHDFIPGEYVSSYFQHTVAVSGEGPTITVLIPNGGEVWGIGSNHNIMWENTGVIANVKIEYSKDGFTGDIHEIIDSTENDGAYLWNVPDDPSDTVRVRVSDASSILINDISDEDFTITEFVPEYWTQFMHDRFHSGRTNVTGPQTNNHVWTYDGPGSNALCTIEGYDGTIYYGTVQNGARIDAVNPDGTEKWVYDAAFSADWARPFGVTPDDSVLFAGTNAASIGEGSIVGLNTSDGTQLWVINNCYISCNAFGIITFDGDLIVSCDVGSSYALMRIDKDGNVIWNQTKDFSWCSSPAQGPDGTIYARSSPNIISVDPATGDTINSFNPGISAAFQSTIAVRPDGKIVFGMWGHVYCLNPDMTLYWVSTAASGNILEGIATGLNNEVYAHESGTLYAFAEDGTVDWTWSGAGGWTSPAVGADGKVYIGTSSGVSAIDNGSTVWSYSPGGWGSGPIIANDGSLYINIASNLHKIKDP